MPSRVATICLLLLLAASALANEVESESDLQPFNWPRSKRTAVPLVVARLTEAQRDEVRRMKRNDLIVLHHEWGMDIRNYLGLWRGNHELLTSVCGALCHPDDASMILMEESWDVLQSQNPASIQSRGAR